MSPRADPDVPGAGSGAAEGSLPLVALVGRPNVGKSTLFNRLVGRRRAAVASMPGLTRDRNYGVCEWTGRRFRVVDTGGLDPAEEDGLYPLLAGQTRHAVEEADAVLCLFDGRAGPTVVDQEVIAYLRSTGRPVLWGVNKVDTGRNEDLTCDFHALGLDPVMPLSGEHGTGVGDVLDRLLEMLGPAVEAGPASGDRPVRVALVGRPNVGKSSLFNRLVGLERAVVDARPGTTIDPVDTLVRYEDRPYLLVDTAGIRRKRASAGAAEGIGVTLGMRAVERCDVALVLLDAAEGLTTGDRKVASIVEERGCAVALLGNKWDLADVDGEAGDAWIRGVGERLGGLGHAPVLTISALTGTRVHKIFPLVDRLRAEATRRIPTPELNRFLRGVLERHPPPLDPRHRPVKVYYAAQVGTGPPRFALFANRPGSIGVPYQRFLVRRLRERYGFEGSPIRLEIRARGRGKGPRGEGGAARDDDRDGAGPADPH